MEAGSGACTEAAAKADANDGPKIFVIWGSCETGGGETSFKIGSKASLWVGRILLIVWTIVFLLTDEGIDGDLTPEGWCWEGFGIWVSIDFLRDADANI